MNNINITYAPSGLGSPAPGEDFISSMIFYATAYPSGFTGSTKTFEVFSVVDAENLGIVPVGGTGATELDAFHYHISEFFRENPTGDLWLTVNTATGASVSYADVLNTQNAANGQIRQTLVYEHGATFSTSNVALLQIQAAACSAVNKPLEIIYQPNFYGLTLSTLPDLSQQTAPNVSVCVGQDGAALGASLYTVLNYSIGIGGIVLGAVSKALVSTSIAWVQNFNVSAVELDTIAFANGTLYSSLADAAITALDNKNYLFLRKFIGIAGSYINNDYTAIAQTSDYSAIHLNRTIHKVARQVRTQLLPSVASPVYFNKDGTMSTLSIAFFKSEAEVALGFMVSNGEISQYNVIINAAQNVLSSKILNINIQIIPVGVANTIDLTIGFVLSF